jgi:flagellar biosynthetic protein FliP
MGTFFSVVSATLLVVGAILVLAHLVRRRPGMGGAALPAEVELRVIRRIGVAPRQGVVLVEAEGERLLLSCGEGGVRFLRALEPGSPDASGRGTGTAADAGLTGVDDVRAELPGSGMRAFEDEIRAVRSLGRPGSGGGWWNRVRTEMTRQAVRWLRRLAPGGAALLLVAVSLGAAPALLPALGMELGLVAQTTGPGAGGEGGTLPEMDLRLGGEGDEGGLRVTGPVGAVLLIGFMTLIPTLLLLMTSFTRILIVLHLLKQALGAQAAPPAHVLTALSLLLTGFIMAPTLTEAHRTAVQPWMAGEMEEVEMLSTASLPFREFMMHATRDEDLALFIDLWGEEPPESVDELPLVVVTSAFVTSELRAAFQMGFAIFLPFVVIDLVVASVLMSMGMFMLPPLMVSLPFKLLLFVLVDGWGLVVGSLVQSFR